MKCTKCNEKISFANREEYDNDGNLKMFRYEKGHLKNCPDYNKLAKDEE